MTNREITDFVRKYGFFCVLTIAVGFYVDGKIKQLLSPVPPAPTYCSIQELTLGTQVSLDGDVYTITTANVYHSMGAFDIMGKRN